jgi:CRP-like cAMP-binding protein
MQGQPVRNLALIRSGSVKIMQLGPNGNEVILWIYGVGNVVGGLSEPTSGYHSCSARAMDERTALVWDHATLQSLMLKYPQIRKNTSQILFTRLNEMEERFREVATEKVARRVALALLRLLKHVGKKVNGGVEISLSREELAQMTGTTLFTTSRLLSRWGEMGFVLPRRESVVVRDPIRLQLVSEEL